MADFDFNESSRARDDVASSAFTDDYIPLDYFTPPNATGGFAETSFIDPNVNAYGRPIDTSTTRAPAMEVRSIPRPTFTTTLKLRLLTSPILPESPPPPDLEITS